MSSSSDREREEERFLPRIFREGLRDWMEEFLPERWWEPSLPRRGRGLAWGPALDFYETEDAYHVEMDLPGWKKEEIKIQKKGNHLEIRGEKREEHEVRKENYIRRERRSGSFVRTVPIPDDADVSSIKAKFEGGLLHATIPKKEEKKKPEIIVEIE